MRAVSLPDDLVNKPLRAEHGIQQKLEIVARSRIAMQIERSTIPQHPSQLQKSRGHHCQVREHIAVTEKQAKGLHCLGNFTTRLYSLMVGSGGASIPLPGIIKGFDLRFGAGAVLLSKQHVVTLIGFERRVEI